MKVVALLSGGKDSCFTIFKARRHGHEVVALAHVKPPSEEADSFMYQSIGSNVVDRIATALQIPLFTVTTNAKAKLQQLSYVVTAGDEVEDLVTLLKDVKEAFPEVQAVCAGALWSDYQRLRVESAASRTGLLSMAFLWRRDQKELLQEMIDSGVDAVIIKVAGIGLNRSHLGKSLKEMKQILFDLETKFGAHVCGEGGEYETLVRWMPGFKKRLELKQVESVLHSDDMYSPVYYLRILDCCLSEPIPEQVQLNIIEGYNGEEGDNFPPVKNQNIIPAPYKVNPEDTFFLPTTKQESISNSMDEKSLTPLTSIGETKNYLYVSIQSDEGGKSGVSQAAKQLKDALANKSDNLGSVISVMLTLDSVSGKKYSEANKGYNEIFAVPECTPPPTRSCVGTFQGNFQSSIEAIIRKNRNLSERDSRTMHVQSLSEWAPPCIGPYSQFVEEDDVIHVCGVLPLYPGSASIPEGMPPKQQVITCTHNLKRMLEASRANINSLGLFFVYVTSPEIVTECNEQLQKSLLHDNSVCAILPVSSLPKGGIIEIRSIGTVSKKKPIRYTFKEGALSRFSKNNTTIQGVTCGNFAFTIFTFFDKQEINLYGTSISEGLEEIHSDIPLSSCLLSIQVYSHSSISSDIRESIRNQFGTCAVSLYQSSWMPNKASLICLLISEI